jgi:hypothetical protein
MIYAHFPGGHRRDFHQKLSRFIKPGGYLILEGFSASARISAKKSTIGRTRDSEMLYDLEELKKILKILR